MINAPNEFEPAEETHFEGIGFQRLVEEIADGVLVVDLSGGVQYANRAAAAIFGYPQSELMNVSLGRPTVSGETSEIEIHRPDGKHVDVEMRVVEITWGGKPALLAGLRDVSARRAVAERQRQSQKLEAIGQLTAGIVHDFNNLITVFLSGLRLLRKELTPAPDNSKAIAIIEEMLKRTQNARALTEQLLTFARRQSLDPIIIDLNERILSLIGLLERTLGRGTKITTYLDPALDPVFIDANQLDITFLNLAVNARDAMPNGGMLTIETSNISSGFEDLGDTLTSFVRITMTDTGCGMTNEVLSRVFEPFFTTKGDGKGTGLGLSQVYGFIHQSGGQIRIESAIGKGTSVHLFLPRSPARDS